MGRKRVTREQSKNKKAAAKQAETEKKKYFAIEDTESELAFKQLRQNLVFLQGQVERYEIRRGRYSHDFKNYTDVYCHWLNFDVISYEEDQFMGIEPNLFKDANAMWKAPDAPSFWKGFDVYRETGVKWRLRFVEKARVKLLHMDKENRKKLIIRCMTLAMGYIHPGVNCNIQQTGPCANMCSFSVKTSANQFMAFMILMDRIPIIREKRIVQYRFENYLKIIDFVNTEKDVKNSIQRYINSIKNDADKWVDYFKDEKNVHTSSYTHLYDFKSMVITHGKIVAPKQYSKVYLTQREADSISYDLHQKRWISDKGGATEKKQDWEIQSTMNKMILDKMSDSVSCASFINLLQTIPNFKIKLTEEESHLIGTPGNVLALGRSGTGKTTCALLRIFASEVLFNYRCKQTKMKKGLVLADTRFGADDIDVRCGLHIVFATASPVLTNEVKRYYERLQHHIKTEIAKKHEEKKHKQDLKDSEEILQVEEKAEEPDDDDLEIPGYSLILARHESESLASRASEDAQLDAVPEDLEESKEGDATYDIVVESSEDEVPPLEGEDEALEEEISFDIPVSEEVDEPSEAAADVEPEKVEELKEQVIEQPAEIAYPEEPEVPEGPQDFSELPDVTKYDQFDATESFDIPESEESKNPELAKEDELIESAFDIDMADETSSESAYSIISKGDSQSSISGLSVIRPDGHEHLSHVNPDDEFLQSESGSVVDNLDSAILKDGSLLSDYSILDNMHAAALNSGATLVKTRADIFVEDETMRKIINYVSMFSEDVKRSLMASRSAQNLVMNEGNVTEDWKLVGLMDLDEIDAEFIGLVLDTLEYFELYKLCLVVCNRYHLPERLGRYVTSIANKYSTVGTTLAIKMTQPIFYAINSERAYVAYTALHNVFEMISPKFLTLKIGEPISNTNSLGMVAFQSLLLLGYWKKLVYTMDRVNSLAVTSTYADFKNYKHIYLLTSGQKIEDMNVVVQDGFDWLPFETPTTMSEVSACILTLDSVIWSMTQIFPYFINSALSLPIEKTPELPAFPQYFVFNSVLWNMFAKRNAKAEKALDQYLDVAFTTIQQIYNKNDFASKVIDLRIYDVFSFFSQLLISIEHNQVIRQKLTKLDSSTFENFLKALLFTVNILTKRKVRYGFSVHMETALYACLAPVRVRKIAKSDVTMALPLYTYAMVNRSSLLTEDLIREIEHGQKVSSALHISDNEGQFYLAPIDMVCHALSVRFIKLGQKIKNARHSLVTHKTYTDLRRIQAYANLFGEIVYFEKIEALMPSDFKQSASSVAYDADRFDPLRETEIQSLKSQLKKLKRLGAETVYLKEYTAAKKKSEIKEIERKLGQLGAYDEDKTYNSKTYLVKFIVKKLSKTFANQLEITSLARNALLEQAQTYYRLIKTQEDHSRVDLILSTYHLCVLCREEIMFAEMLRARYRPVIKNGTKQSAYSIDFLYDQALLDTKAYWDYGCYEEAAGSLFAYFGVQFQAIPIELVLGLMEKVIVFSLLATYDVAYLPSRMLEYLPKLKKGKILGKLTQVQDLSLIDETLYWLGQTFQQLVNRFGVDDRKVEQERAKWCLQMIAVILINGRDFSYDTFRQFYDAFKSLTVAKHSYFTTAQFFKELMRINEAPLLYSFMDHLKTELEKDINSASNKSGKGRSLLLSQLWNQELSRAEVAERDLDRDCDYALESAWIDEKRTMSQHVAVGKLVNKAISKRRYKRIRIKNPISNTLDIMGLSSLKYDLRLGVKQASDYLRGLWETKRTSMRMYQSTYRYFYHLTYFNYTNQLNNVLDRHFISAQFNSLGSKIRTFEYMLLEKNPSLLKYVRGNMQELEEENVRFNAWKEIAAPKVEYDPSKKRKKHWQSKWVERTAKALVDKARKRAGKKKQNYLQDRARRLKNR